MSKTQTTLEEKLKQYKPSPEAAEILGDIPVVFLVGISGAGKDTIKSELLKRYTNEYHHIVSHTTRQPRENHGVMEQNGHEYHFITLETAEQMLDNHEYIEAKKYGSNVYGTSLQEFRVAKAEGRIAITDLEVQGVDEYVALAPSVKPIFILPPNYATWQQRLQKRYGGNVTEHQEDIKERMQTAIKELQHALAVDYFYFVVNDDLDACVTEVNELAHMRGERMGRNHSARETAAEILEQLQQDLQKS